MLYPLLQIVKVVVEADKFQVPVSNQKVSYIFGSGITLAVKSDKPMPKESHYFLEIILGAQIYGFLGKGKGSDQIEVTVDDDLAPAADILVPVFKFGVAMLDSDVCFLVGKLIPAEA